MAAEDCARLAAMIRYPNATPARIAADVEAHAPTWLARALSETQRLIQAGAFRAPPAPPPPPGSRRRAAKPPSLWADVKIVYMRLQHYKCIFCERGLAREEGKIEQDVEHYRPKNAVKAWRSPKGHPAIPHQAGGAAETGYYWLAYEPGNYAAACKPCNTTHKGSYFPIAGSRGAAADDIDTLDQNELPYLIFPMREDPARLITFRGAMAVPVRKRGHDFLRAMTTITVFKLNSPELVDERSRLIRLLSTELELVTCAPRQAVRDRALLNIADLTGTHASYSACGKAFLELTKAEPIVAAEIVERAWAVLPARVSNT